MDVLELLAGDAKHMLTPASQVRKVVIADVWTRP
jgi:hypothetical protein